MSILKPSDICPHISQAAEPTMSSTDSSNSLQSLKHNLEMQGSTDSLVHSHNSIHQPHEALQAPDETSTQSLTQIPVITEQVLLGISNISELLICATVCKTFRSVLCHTNKPFWCCWIDRHVLRCSRKSQQDGSSSLTASSLNSILEPKDASVAAFLQASRHAISRGQQIIQDPQPHHENSFEQIFRAQPAHVFNFQIVTTQVDQPEWTPVVTTAGHPGGVLFPAVNGPLAGVATMGQVFSVEYNFKSLASDLARLTSLAQMLPQLKYHDAPVTPFAVPFKPSEFGVLSETGATPSVCSEKGALIHKVLGTDVICPASQRFRTYSVRSDMDACSRQALENRSGAADKQPCQQFVNELFNLADGCVNNELVQVLIASRHPSIYALEGRTAPIVWAGITKASAHAPHTADSGPCWLLIGFVSWVKIEHWTDVLQFAPM